MNILIVLAHPNKNSYSAAVSNSIKDGFVDKGHNVKVKDLYQENFNPVMTYDDLGGIFSGKIPSDIKKEQEDVLWADRLVFVYPIWWLDKPAILKGWIDKVLVYGFAYTIDQTGSIKGLLKHDKALVVQLAGSPEIAYQKSYWQFALNPSLSERTLEFCGIKNTIVKNLIGVGQSDPKQRETWLSELRDFARDW